MTRSKLTSGFLFAFILFVSFFQTIIATGQNGNKARSIHLKSGDIPTTENARAWLESVAKMPVAPEPAQVLIQFTTLPTVAQHTALRQAGITLLDYIPDNTYSAIVRYPLNTGPVLSTPVYSITNMKPEWKADSYLWKKTASQTGMTQVLVSFYRTIDAATIKQFIAGVGGQLNPSPMEKYGAYKVTIAANKVRTIAQWYGVRYISPATEIVPLDLQSRPAVKGNISVASPANGGYGLTGEGVTAGVGDNASGIYHADLKDRITNFNPAREGHHGEHVNGIVGGAAVVDPLAASMAPHVSLVDFLYDLILPATGAMYQDFHMTITNNSYTVMASDCDYAGTYDIYSQFLDTLSVQYPEVQHVFASANDGWMNCTPFLQGFATVGGGYQPAKNNIVVGSMTDYLFQAGDESRGPVKDGRLKPEIVAIGLGAYSTIGVDGYGWAAGTSMASPQVVGGLAILTERYKQLHGIQPRADILKAILLNGAMDLGNPGPDFTYGFGSMDMSRSLQIMDNNHHQTNTIDNSDSQSFTITVPANTAQIKVMLCWNDVPASASSARQLVNDLDLSLIDPSAVSHMPLVPDPTPANVNNVATEQIDHLNNTEQITITNPLPGTYTIKVKGYNIPFGPQRYVVAYDLIPRGIQLTYPIGGEQLSNIDSIRIFWNTVSSASQFTAQFSQDNGGNWTTISDHIPATDRYVSFMPTGINSGNCLVRVFANTIVGTVTSGRFAINTQPIATADPSQCPGYININWTSVPNASSYYLYRKIGFYMQLVDSTTSTSYSFSGMSLTDKSYVAVQPVINGIAGYRSVAVIAIANTGDCSKPVSNGDLTIEKMVSPGNGRMNTSTQFTSATEVKVQLRNLYRSDCSFYTLSYQVNGGAWQTLVNPGNIPANSSAVISIPGISMTAPGSYNINVAVHNLVITDPQPANDSISFTIVSIPNDPIDLAAPFLDDFETMGKFTASRDSVGVSPNGHWDFFNDNDSGRMRSFVNADVTIDGDRSVSLDQNQNLHSGSRNTFAGTFNLSNYDTATTEVRLDFDYVLHGTPKSADGNEVTARGDDTSAWMPFFSYNLNAYPGFLSHVLSLSITDAVRLNNRNFSSSTQIAFGQNDTSLIAAPDYGNGITLDNVKLYTVANDAALTNISSPLPTNCGASAPIPVTVQVHNGVNYTLHNVQLFYSLDGGPVFTGDIDSIRAKATVNYTFDHLVDLPPGTTHSLSVWLSQPGDTYLLNDSLLDFHIRNSQIITSFPYLENFEGGDGGYFSEGFRSSWQYGSPASPKINKAASGTKAWKTNLTGHYNNLEKGYLYSPCFDISLLYNPVLSFSTALDIENCGGTLCDAAYVEYSFDGANWKKLGLPGIGTNWYDSSFYVWNTQDFTRWHVATIPIPQLGSGQTTHFRFVLSSDPGSTLEGFAIDDIHIYDRTHPIYTANGTTTVSQEPSSNEWTEYVAMNQLLAAVQPHNQSLDKTSVTLYSHDTITNPGQTQFTFPRSYTVMARRDIADSIDVRLYLLDSDIVKILADTTCPSCTPVTDAYSLGITQYAARSNSSTENGTLADDTSGTFAYYPSRSITWVPYDKGYYASLRIKPLSELWFNNGGPTGTFPAGIDYLNFVAFRSGQTVKNYWYSLIDEAVDNYTPQWSLDSTNFADITDVPAKHANPGEYLITDPVNFGYGTFYFRLKWTMTGKEGVYYSPIRRVDPSDSSDQLVNLDARMKNSNSVLVNWTSFLDGTVDHYLLERAINNDLYTVIDNAPSLHHYGQQYNFTDHIIQEMAGGIPVHYRLTAVLEDGSSIVLPIRTLKWINANTFANIYPNPTFDGNFSINWFADTGTVMQVNMTDAVGRSLYQTAVAATQWNNSITLQPFLRTKGMYFVRLSIGGRKYTAKLVYE